MSDYLNKLVMRTLGTRPAAQPLMMPLYAPDSTLAERPMATLRPEHAKMDDSLGATNLANNELVPNQRPAAASRQMASAEPLTPPPSLDKQVNHPNLAVITEPDLPLLPGLDDQASVQKVEIPWQQAPKLPASATHETLNERQGEPVAISVLAQSEPRDSGARQSAQTATQQVETTVDGRLVANHQAPPTLVQAGPRATQPTEFPQSPFVAPPTVRPVGLRNSQLREMTPERAATPTPTIQVTIGRVEVRAIQPPAPAMRTQPKAETPAIALEDYLRGQTGGQR